LQGLVDGEALAAVITACTLTLLVRNGGPDGEPDQQAVDELLDAGGVPALLRITSLSDSAALAAVEVLHLIAHEPRAETEIAAADCARPLITALGAAFKCSLDDVRNKGKADVRAHVIGLIGRLVDGRPDLGQAFLMAGIVGELEELLTPAREVVERKLAMQLVEKLIRHAPGACDAMKARGVFTDIHQLALGAPKAVGDKILGMGAGALPPEATDAILEAEPLQARAVLCMAAAQCGGVLDVKTVDGELLQYSREGVVPPSPRPSQASPPPTPWVAEAIRSPGPGTPKASPPRSPSTPEAAPTPSHGTPEAAAMPSPTSLEACPPANSGAADATGEGKLLPSGPGTPEVTAAQPLAHAKVRRPSRRVCSMCGAVSQQKLQVCTRCRRAAYCGRECQAAHWPVHKSECRGVA
jgi:hypothetical protein